MPWSSSQNKFWWPWVLASATLAALLVAAGCASTNVEITGAPLKEPLCLGDAPALPAVVYWGPQWRPDQKEPALRDAAALQGIQDSLGRHGCIAVTGIHRLPANLASPSDEQIMSLASVSSPAAQRVVLIFVRELGPRLVIGLPVIIEGGTEVVIEVRVLDTRTSESLANARTHWRNGGMFVIKGVGTLAQDMAAALDATLMPNLPVR